MDANIRENTTNGGSPVKARGCTGVWITVMLVAILAVNAAVGWHVSKTVGGVKDLPIALPGEFREKFEHDMAQELAYLSSNIADVCKHKVRGNEIEAERAYGVALQCMKSGDIEMAKVYCINAINHSPTRKCYFEKLVELNEGGGKTTRESYEQIKGMLELGVFQVAADDVAGMRDMLARTIARIGELEAQERVEREQADRAAAECALARLRDGDLKFETMLATDGVVRVAMLQRRLSALDELVNADLKAEDVAWRDGQSVRTRAAHDYYCLEGPIDSYLDKAEALMASGPAKLGAANIAVQTASQLLSQALGMDAGALPADASGGLQSRVARIEGIERKFNRIKSQPAFADIERIVEDAAAIEVSAPYQQKIDSLENALQKACASAASVYDREMRLDADELVKVVSAKLGECRQAQYKAYQSWAIGKCAAGMNLYRSWYRVDIPDAKRVINEHLIEIDSTLLTPDVSRLYNEVLRKQIEELKGETVSMEINIAKAKKKSLSDF